MRPQRTAHSDDAYAIPHRRLRPVAPRLSGIPLALAAVILSAACHSAGAAAAITPADRSPIPATGTSSSTTAGASPADPAAAAAIGNAEALYQGYVTEYYNDAHTDDYEDQGLARYLSTGPLSLSQHDLITLSDHAAVQLGTATATILSASADLSGTPPTVTLTTCLDISEVQVVYESNQSPVPDNSPAITKFMVTVLIQRYSNGQWLIASQTAHRTTPC